MYSMKVTTTSCRRFKMKYRVVPECLKKVVGGLVNAILDEFLGWEKSLLHEYYTACGFIRDGRIY